MGGRPGVPPVRAPHLATLTSLRFIAALLVLGVHVSDGLDPFAGSRDVFSMGYLALSFFFVLSGFVLTWTHDPGDRLRTFYGRRVARVWPLHLITTAAAALLLWLAGAELDLLTLALVATLLHAFVPDSGVYYSYNDVSWSLSCEAFFYLLLPLLLVLAARHVRRPLRWLLGTGATLVVITATVHLSAPFVAAATGLPPIGLVGYTLEIFPGYRLGEFAVGVLTGLAFQQGTRGRLHLGAALLSTAGCLVVLTASDVAVDIPHGVANLIALPFFVVLVLAAATDDLDGRRSWLHAPALVRFGQASLALYLVHFLVLREIQDRLLPAVAPWVAALLVVLVSLPLADLLHRHAERPLERLVRRVLCATPPAPSPSGQWNRLSRAHFRVNLPS